MNTGISSETPPLPRPNAGAAPSVKYPLSLAFDRRPGPRLRSGRAAPDQAAVGPPLDRRGPPRHRRPDRDARRRTASTRSSRPASAGRATTARARSTPSCSRAFPDNRFALTEIVVGPQGVFEVATLTGTNEGPWAGAPPSGLPVALQVLILFPWDPATKRFSGERIWFDRGTLPRLTGRGPWPHAARRRRRRRRAQRARRGDHAGPRRPVGPGPRGGRDDRRRDADRGADAPRLPPRRLLDDPAARRPRRRSSGRSTSPPAASSSSIPTRRSPTRSTAAGRSCSSARSRPRRPALGARDGARLAPAVRAARATPPTQLLDELLGPVVHLPRHPLALARFGLPALLPATAGPARASAATRRGRCSPGSRRTRCSPRRGRSPRRSGCVLGLFAHAVGWPMVRGGSAAIADALGAELATLGGEIVDRTIAVGALASCRRRRVVLLDTTPRAAAARSPATGCRRPTRRRVRARSATARACSRSTGRSTGRSRGRPTARGARRRSTSAGRSARSRRREADGRAGRPPGAAVRPARPDAAGIRRARPAGQAHGLGVLPRAERLARST